MGLKRVTDNSTYYSQNAVSSSFNTSTINLPSQANGFSIQFDVSNESSLGGSAKVQVSNDGTSWFDLDETVFTLSGNTGTFWDVTTNAKIKAARVAVTITAGSADFDMYLVISSDR